MSECSSTCSGTTLLYSGHLHLMKFQGTNIIMLIHFYLHVETSLIKQNSRSQSVHYVEVPLALYTILVSKYMHCMQRAWMLSENSGIMRKNDAVQNHVPLLHSAMSSACAALVLFTHILICSSHAACMYVTSVLSAQCGMCTLHEYTGFLDTLSLHCMQNMCSTHTHTPRSREVI